MEQTKIAHRPARVFIMPRNIGAANRALQAAMLFPPTHLSSAEARAHSRNKPIISQQQSGTDIKQRQQLHDKKVEATKEGVRQKSEAQVMH